MNAPGKVEKAKKEPDNLRIWNDLSKTDPAQTKQFSRAGGFRGTAVKPMWVIKRLTEQFGPCGEGWGIGEPKFQVVPTDFGEILVYCTVPCWHGSPENVLYGVGGDKVLTQRSERAFHDDEAFKKAFTDAVNNAFKFVGVAADIHMGLFDDSKYVAEVRDEFSAIPTNEPAAREKLAGPHTSKTALKAAITKILRQAQAAENIEVLDAVKAEHKQTINQARRDWPELIEGDPNVGEDIGLKGVFERRRAELTPSEDSLSLQMLLSVLETCDSRNDLSALLDEHGAVAEALDGEESRKWEAAYNEREAAIMAIANVGAG